jgi:hypothetical protein
MITTIFDLYLETISTEVDRLQSGDFGAMCVDAGWDVSSLESILHERHQVFNKMNDVELDKELCDIDKNKIERHISKIARFYGKKMYLAKDILTTDNKTIGRQYSQMDDCLKILKADDETTERIKSSYESLLLKYSMAVREFLQEMDDYEIRIVDDNPTESEKLIQQIDSILTCKYKSNKSLPLKKLYDYLIETESIPKDINYSDFIKHVQNADFSKEFNGCKKCNLKYAIDRLRKYYDNPTWQIESCKSIGIDKINDISKHNVTKEFKRLFDKKIKLPQTK